MPLSNADVAATFSPDGLIQQQCSAGSSWEAGFKNTLVAKLTPPVVTFAVDAPIGASGEAIPPLWHIDAVTDRDVHRCIRCKRQPCTFHTVGCSRPV